VTASWDGSRVTLCAADGVSCVRLRGSDLPSADDGRVVVPSRSDSRVATRGTEDGVSANGTSSIEGADLGDSASVTTEGGHGAVETPLGNGHVTLHDDGTASIHLDTDRFAVPLR
jgi:hypothetical protein